MCCKYLGGFNTHIYICESWKKKNVTWFFLVWISLFIYAELVLAQGRLVVFPAWFLSLHDCVPASFVLAACLNSMLGFVLCLVELPCMVVFPAWLCSLSGCIPCVVIFSAWLHSLSVCVSCMVVFSVELQSLHGCLVYLVAFSARLCSLLSFIPCVIMFPVLLHFQLSSLLSFLHCIAELPFWFVSFALVSCTISN